jgi:hypothetical protein
MSSGMPWLDRPSSPPSVQRGFGARPGVGLIAGEGDVDAPIRCGYKLDFAPREFHDFKTFKYLKYLYNFEILKSGMRFFQDFKIYKYLKYL